MVPGKLKELYYDIHNKYRNTTEFTSFDSEYIFNNIVLKKYLGIDPSSERANNVRSKKEYLRFDETMIICTTYHIILNMLRNIWPDNVHNVNTAWNTIMGSYASMILSNILKYKNDIIHGGDTKEYTKYMTYMKQEIKNIQESERVS